MKESIRESMIYGYMIESNNKSDILNLLKTTNESFYYVLADQITSENTTFRKILESVDILKGNNILTEDNEEIANKTLLDKLIIIFRKACLFFSKVKNEAYKKFTDVAYKRLSDIKDSIANTVRNNINDPKLLEKMAVDTYFISDKSVDSYNAFIKAINEIDDELNDAYDNSDLEKANNIDFSKLPNFKLELDKESIEEPIRTLAPSLYNITIKRLDQAKKMVDDNISNIDHMQELLTRKLKIKEINHNQMRIASKMIDQFNYIIKAAYQFINALIKVAYIDYQSLQKIEAKLK